MRDIKRGSEREEGGSVDVGLLLILALVLERIFPLMTRETRV